MNRQHYYDLLSAPARLDYELYLDTGNLLACQKPMPAMINADELQFQIVHQVEELWMKLMIHTLLDIDDHMRAGHAHKVVTLFSRCNMIMKLMSEQLDLLETMSPHDYQQIRLQLGNGSGQESPGFRTLMKMPPELWETFEAVYLTGRALSVRDIYDTQYRHDDAYVIAECLMEFDERMGKFRANHIFLIQRSIGMGAASLKGRPVELLDAGARHRFFPALWAVRAEMTDDWGQEYGKVRESLGAAE
ncbi:tryptophan 2,3-dioxygenase family protein [Asticcacaulis sp. 201]|uniref:tryptophan 2,3-dioxygenase family protein n=1 Tax=Asticcacaulis sp. 201 TaxID=3028787 RepID=UPI0029161135|nr:tryptophan 2,3-dioxygenase family protein [Asticcacaulis sp. 201]MDV6331989.1 tryptophan 2,3-dioxygenase family protein [Asticcacaulis sp. 201]